MDRITPTQAAVWTFLALAFYFSLAVLGSGHLWTVPPEPYVKMSVVCLVAALAIKRIKKLGTHPDA